MLNILQKQLFALIDDITLLWYNLEKGRIMKEMMRTYEAIARGAYEAGVRVLSAGPSHKALMADRLTNYDIVPEWAINEKAAMEIAIGGAVCGVRSMVCLKHGGLNLAADPLFASAYTGINAGLVIVVTDDVGVHASQTEQDSRFYARSSHVPMLEPSDSAETKDFVKLAFQLSEHFDIPVIIRITSRLMVSGSMVDTQERECSDVQTDEITASKYAMLPANALVRRKIVEERDCELAEYVNTMEINRAEHNKGKMGVVCSGIVYEYVKEALPNADVFKVGTVYPLPIRAIRAFAQKVSQLFVIEELEPFIELQLRAAGIKCNGKDFFPLHGELSVEKLLEKFNHIPRPDPEKLPIRLPASAAKKSAVAAVLEKLGVTVNGDTDVFSLGAGSVVSTLLCTGASVGMAQGFRRAKNLENIALIGGSAFLHSGINALAGGVLNNSDMTVVIVDDLDETAIKLDEVCKALGVKSVTVVGGSDGAELEKAIKSGLKNSGVSVIIAKEAK